MTPDIVDPATEILRAMSDGGVVDEGTDKAKASYGYVIRSKQLQEGWGNFTFLMSGRGQVEGTNAFIDSTRAEAKGLVATMHRILSTIQNFPHLKHIDHATDNEAVVNMYVN